MGKPWEAMGYEDTKLLTADAPTRGMAVGLQRLIFGGRIVVGDAFDTLGYSECYDYESMQAAREAFLAWDGIGEPEGWIRHEPSGRRRPDADAAKELRRQADGGA